MNLISMMELNARGSYVWDWENLVMLSSKSTSEVPKKLHMVDYGFEAVEEGFEVGPMYYLEGRGVGSANGVSASDLGFGSSSKSSNSASVNFLTNLEVKESRFLSETKDDTPELSFKKELHNGFSGGISSMSQTSANPGEWMLDLKLGKKAYFEDVSAGTSEKMAAVATRRSKSSSPVVNISYCQVEGCNLDLSSAKDYYRKHRICETHSKSPKVIVGGLERRFCQQCSRFHNMSEFDQTKRSCRKRLSDHNARRRKPKPKMMHFDSIRPPPSLYTGRHQVDIAFDQVPWPVQTRLEGNVVKNAQEGFSLFTSSKSGVMDALLDPGIKLGHESRQLLSPKGLQARMSSSSMDAAAAHDLRALSLLSSNSWGSCEPELGPLSVIKPPQAPTVGNDSPLPAASSAYWQGGPSIVARDHHHQEFQLFKDPQEPSVYSY